jgi:hypothetical protein
MKYIIILLLVVVGVVSAQDSIAYIDPGTAGAVAGGIGAGVGVVFAFFGSLAIAAMIKIKKLWHWNFFGKIIIVASVITLIALAYFAISFFIG